MEEKKESRSSYFYDAAIFKLPSLRCPQFSLLHHIKPGSRSGSAEARRAAGQRSALLVQPRCAALRRALTATRSLGSQTLPF